MPAQRPNQSLLLELQENLSADLFASAAPLRLAADQALFLAGDTGDGCYLVEDGLLKVVVASHSGGERVLAFSWARCHCRRNVGYRRAASLCIRGGGASSCIKV